jgi:hypothetical protein
MKKTGQACGALGSSPGVIVVDGTSRGVPLESRRHVAALQGALGDGLEPFVLIFS